MSDGEAHTSATGTRLVGLLSDAGIEAQQRSYEFDAPSSGGQTVGFAGNLGGQMVARVAVLVHNRDRERAVQIAREMNQQLERARRSPPIADDELMREALEAGPPPDES